MSNDKGAFTYEARTFRFVTVRKPSLLNEYVFGPITLKHLLALMVSLLLFGIGNKVPLLSYVCVTLAVLTLACAFYPPKAMSLETTLFAFVMTLLDMVTYNSRKKPRGEIILERVDVKEGERPIESILSRVNVNIGTDVSVNQMSIEEILEYKPMSKKI